jgi:hypothetical protein
MAVHFTPHPALDPDLPIRITLALPSSISSEVGARIHSNANLFAKFANTGGFAEVNGGTSATVTTAGNVCHVDLQGVPADRSVLGVLGRLLIGSADEMSVQVQGTPARTAARALDPLPEAFAFVPSLREPLSVNCDMSPGIGWYSLELSKQGDWGPGDADVLRRCTDVWMETCRAGGLSEVSSTFDVEAGNVGMDPPQVGVGFWSAQIGATEVDLGAVASLINMLDYASHKGLGLERIEVT